MTDLDLMRQALGTIEDLMIRAANEIDGWANSLDAEETAAMADAMRARLAEPVQPVARWYVLSHDGMACLCANEADAVVQAADADKLFPRHAPHQAVQMAPIAAPAEAPTVQPVAVPDDFELENMAASACQEALAYGVSEEAFLKLARTVRAAMLDAAPKGGAQ